MHEVAVNINRPQGNESSKGILFHIHKDQFSSVQFSHSVVSNSLRPHKSQYVRPPCPSPTPRVHPNPCPLSQWCHPTISSSVVTFSSCPQSLPASGSFQMSQLFTSGRQSIGVSASTLVLPVNTQDWSPLGWTGWISLKSTLSRIFSIRITNQNTDNSKCWWGCEKMEPSYIVRDFMFMGSKICRWWLQPLNKRMLALQKKSFDQPRKYTKK